MVENLKASKHNKSYIRLGLQYSHENKISFIVGKKFTETANAAHVMLVSKQLAKFTLLAINNY